MTISIFRGGGDVGGSFSTTSATSATATSGMTVNLAASVTGTFVYQINPHWGVIVPLRGMYVSTLGGWNPIVEAGIVWKP